MLNGLPVEVAVAPADASRCEVLSVTQYYNAVLCKNITSFFAEKFKIMRKRCLDIKNSSYLCGDTLIINLLN